MEDIIFNKKFLEIDKVSIIDNVNKNGFFFFEEALNQKFVQKIEEELSNKDFGLNVNTTNPVYTKAQYFFSNAMTASKEYFNLITSEKIFSIAKTKYNKDFRLKAQRYYETKYGNYMPWHADNVDNNGVLHKNDGLIMIIYINDVFDGEFQLIEGSNLKIEENKRDVNYIADKYVEENYKDNIKSFKGKSGSIIIYDTWHFHRAKPIKDKNFVRKSIFLQIDNSDRNAEKLLLTPDFFNEEKFKNIELLKFLGFGNVSDFASIPAGTIKNLPNKQIIKLTKLLSLTIIKNIIKRILIYLKLRN